MGHHAVDFDLASREEIFSQPSGQAIVLLATARLKILNATKLKTVNIRQLSENILAAMDALVETIDLDPSDDQAITSATHAAISQLRDILPSLKPRAAEDAYVEIAAQRIARALAILHPLSCYFESRVPAPPSEPVALPKPDSHILAPSPPTETDTLSEKPETLPRDNTVEPLRTNAAGTRRTEHVPQTPRRARPVPAEILERRRSHRAGIQAEIGFQSDTNFFTGFSEDVSTGGLFVATFDIRPIGATLNINFTLPWGKLISADGVVRWIREYNELTPDTSPGMGVQFQNLTREKKEAIEAFIRERPAMFFDTD